MHDPIERMVQFLREQKRLAAFEHACSLWSRRLPILLPGVREVVEVFRCGLEEAVEQPSVSVLVDPKHTLSPLVIAFDARDSDYPGPLRIHRDRPREIGASAVFRCGPDSIVYGIRYPFHTVERDPRPIQFADLGEPEEVQARQLGHAVVDFLEWASIGEGCGSRRLRFWSPPVAQQPIRLGLVA